MRSAIFRFRIHMRSHRYRHRHLRGNFVEVRISTGAWSWKGRRIPITRSEFRHHRTKQPGLLGRSGKHRTVRRTIRQPRASFQICAVGKGTSSRSHRSDNQRCRARHASQDALPLTGTDAHCPGGRAAEAPQLCLNHPLSLCRSYATSGNAVSNSHSACTNEECERGQ